jgi:hypothetical protein
MTQVNSTMMVPGQITVYYLKVTLTQKEASYCMKIGFTHFFFNRCVFDTINNCNFDSDSYQN